MAKHKFMHIYGPVPSWRMGNSLGVDLLPENEKICTFDCVYCQLGPTLRFERKRKEFVPAEEIFQEIRALPEVHIDYITFSGMGEPTLAANLGDVIRKLRGTRKEKIAVITNSTLLDLADVRRDLAGVDLVVAKLDAAGPNSLARISRPMSGIRWEGIVEALKRFRRGYRGRLALQVMFVEENRAEAGKLARLALEINPDEVQINTPLRTCPCRPLSEKEMEEITAHFLNRGMKVISVYEARKRQVDPINKKDTLRRRGEL